MTGRLPLLFLLALLAGIQLVFWQEAQDAFNPVQLLWAKVLIPLALAPLLLMRWPGWDKLRSSAASRAALLWMLWLGIRGALSPSREAGLKIALEYALYTLLFFAPMVLGAAERARALAVFFTASLLAALYGFFQHFGMDPWRWSTNFGGRPLGTLGNPNFFGGHLVLAWGICLGLALRRPRPLWWGCLALLTLVQLWSRTVGVWLGMALSAAALLAWQLRQGGDASRRALKALVLALVAAGALLALQFPKLKNEKGASVTNRLMMWQVAGNLWQEKPLQGVGLTEYRKRFPDTQARYLAQEKGWNYVVTWLPHQNFLYILCELGLIGLGLFCWAWIASFTSAWQRLKDGDWEAWCAALGSFSLVGVSLLNTFSNIPATAAGFWFLLGLLAWRPSGAAPRPVLALKPALALGAALALVLGAYAGREVAGHRLIRQGLREKKKGELRAAALHLKKAADMDLREFTPQTLVGVWYELAEVYRAGGALKESAAAYERDLRENPFAPETHNMLGANLGQLGDNAGAARHLSEAIRLSPGYTSALLNLGIARVGAGDAAGAEAAWRKVLEAEPGNADAAAYLGQLQRMRRP